MQVHCVMPPTAGHVHYKKSAKPALQMPPSPRSMFRPGLRTIQFAVSAADTAGCDFGEGRAGVRHAVPATRSATAAGVVTQQFSRTRPSARKAAAMCGCTRDVWPASHACRPLPLRQAGIRAGRPAGGAAAQHPSSWRARQVCLRVVLQTDRNSCFSNELETWALRCESACLSLAPLPPWLWACPGPTSVPILKP